MSFADELRNAPNKKREEEELEKRRIQQEEQEDWENLIVMILNRIKDKCLEQAEDDETEVETSMYSVMKKIDKEYTEIKEEHDETYLCYDVLYYKINSEEGKMWKRMRKHFYHFTLGKYVEKTKRKYPYQFGMKEDVVAYINDEIKTQMKKDGLNVETTIKEVTALCHEEYVYKEYTSSMDRLLTGENGRYVKTRIEDEYIYDIKIKIEW